MTDTFLVLGSVEILNEGTPEERKQATFEKQAKSEMTGKLRRVIGSGATIASFFPNRYNKLGDEVPNRDYADIDDFVGDIVPGMSVATIRTTPFNFPKDDVNAEPRTSVVVVTMNDGDVDRAALYQLRGTGATFTGSNGEELTATTAAEQDMKVKAAQLRTSKLKASTTSTPQSGELSELAQKEAQYKVITDKIAAGGLTPAKLKKLEAEAAVLETEIDALDK